MLFIHIINFHLFIVVRITRVFNKNTHIFLRKTDPCQGIDFDECYGKEIEYSQNSTIACFNRKGRVKRGVFNELIEQTTNGFFWKSQQV